MHKRKQIGRFLLATPISALGPGSSESLQPADLRANTHTRNTYAYVHAQLHSFPTWLVIWPAVLPEEEWGGGCKEGRTALASLAR